MSTMSEHLTWVSDKLHELVGISDKSIAEFILGLCSQSKSPADFIQKIKDTDCIDINDQVRAFSNFCTIHQKLNVILIINHLLFLNFSICFCFRLLKLFD